MAVKNVSTVSATEGDVVIIGAGLAGTALALALHQQSISCRIYEAKSLGHGDAAQIASGVILTPNGLKVLDALGVYDRIKSRCRQIEYRCFKNDKDETIRKPLVATEELYGFKNHRLYRSILLNEMKAMLQEYKVPIVYGASYEGIVAEDDNGVTFLLNGKQERASMLIGTDGIYSSVRKYLNPGVNPEYTGTIGVLSHIKWSTVKWPYPDYEKNCTIQGKPGAIFFIAEVPDGSEIMVGKQTQYPDMTRAEWEAMAADKDKMCEFYRQGYDEWHDTVKSIIDSVCAHKETLFLWPFLRMPKLERWFSDTGRVLLLGDAAHAVPPSSGQGVNQALEDIYSLTKLLNSGKDLIKTLQFWQSMRQKRIDEVFDFATKGTNVQRMPEAERLKLIQEGKATPSESVDDTRWLYDPKLDQVIQEWIETAK